MRKSAFLLVFIATCMALAVSCGRKPKVIPASTFAKMYEEMLLADQWIVANPAERKHADTTWFYDPIFEKYGYDRQDYYKSVSYYCRDFRTFSNIFQEVQADLDTQIVVLGQSLQKEMMNGGKGQRQRFSGIVPFYGDIIYDFVVKDSIDLELDDKGIYQLKKIEPEVTYKGPRVIYKKSSNVVAPTQIDTTSAAINLPEPIALEKAKELNKMDLPDVPAPAINRAKERIKKAKVN